MKEIVVAALACPRSFSVDLAVLGFDGRAPSAVPKIKSRKKNYYMANTSLAKTFESRWSLYIDIALLDSHKFLYQSKS